MMQLYYSPTSPFSRKVRVVLRELGLEKQVSEILIDPWTDAALRAHNPLAKVPTLILEDRMAVFESAVICDYLDQLARSKGQSEGVIPQSGGERLNALKWQGLADGMMAATGRLFADSKRDETDRSDFVMERQAAAVQSAIDAILDGLPQLRTEAPHIGTWSVLVGLYYIDFRWPERRFDIPVRVRDWMAIMSERESLTETVFHLPHDTD
ncbi:glutathione S-transferase [Thalassospira profundimaris]|uniref:glutathione S-transferase N-terminal domain-containing protein n=1 Tax=Thalassospira profundimaris TaxID=502049 RepID=UPI000DEE1241|nr:glutathione S-transferase [Thalassospira profundimaris]